MKKQTQQSELIDKINAQSTEITHLKNRIAFLNDDIKCLTAKNNKLKKKLQKALTWADLRNKQTGQLINSIEAIATKKTIGDAMGNIMNKITGGK